MNPNAQAKHVGIIFIAILLISGVVLMYRGNDAVALSTEKKEGIVTAEQIKLSFDSVSGRLINESVTEGQLVKTGDLIMQLDPTDTDLSIAQLKAQIAQLDAQIKSTSGSMGLSFYQARNDEQQSFRQIDSQRAALASAKATLENAELDYNRNLALVNEGAIARSVLDDSQTNLNIARANVNQQQQILDQLLAGINDTGHTDSLALPTIEREKAAAQNMENDIEALNQQKKALEVQLQQLEVAKSRLTLYAPEDGKILSVLAKKGEMISPSVPVVLLESRRFYYDIYVAEDQLGDLHVGTQIIGRTVAGDRPIKGTIRLITQAPGFADLKQTREKAQADLTAFQIRIYIDSASAYSGEVLPGQTIGVEFDE
ncbi:MAG: HlyD family secretion protein [Selenomonadaceae bacterium]|nr:HlyD family secretion protein [Selenomonadaceae bacterium]